MRTIIDNSNEVYLDANLNKLNEWWIETTSTIYKQDRLIYCVKIDDQIMYQGYENYIANNFEEIQEIVIETKSKEDSFLDTKVVIDQYLINFIPACSRIADYFYTEMNEERWSEFSQFIKGLNWLIHSFEFLQVLDPTANMNFILNRFEQTIIDLNDSLTRQEYVLVGDLIKYEILPLLEDYVA